MIPTPKGSKKPDAFASGFSCVGMFILCILFCAAELQCGLRDLKAC